ncbi:hypothetical protein [Polaribacter aquimarinus]|uniref:Class I SAM-dependent methyltransferase n=1 Tax=Polaribacter aquimarinus TaxID=2100726 RepID=A0A2U2J7Z7_9FLAO|nr:hypothetical protein [Polaribacter aquimarinus]PWG04465.1 hypothetical protein DIS07_13755 [Polaribacter aquimarinus]
MSRVHLFEIADFKWFPQFLRNYLTDFLQFLSNKTKLYKPIITVIEKGLDLCKTNQIIDLASGGGGGLLWLNSELQQTNPDLKILLTDYFPNITAFEFTKKQANNIEYVSNSVDARNVPKNLKGLRTQFLSFHHFKPIDAKLILQNAIDSNTAIAIFEAQERTIPSILAMLFSPISVLVTTPFIKPFKIGRIIFTYLIPIIPIVTLWDGIVSSLRTYSVKEMTELVNQLDNKDDFYWDINRIKSGPGAILYLLGTPKNITK